MNKNKAPEFIGTIIAGLMKSISPTSLGLSWRGMI